MKQGLSKNQVLELQEKYGLNEIQRKAAKSKLAILIDILKDPILLIMIVAAAISLLSAMDDKHFAEFYVISLLVLVNIIISFVQEVKTLQKLDALNSLNEDTAVVIRDGVEEEILSKYLVPGDIVKLKLGHIARADIKLLESNNLFVDEAFLTGESDEVNKLVDDIIYSNSPIKNGECLGEVFATGLNTKIGKIASEVDDVEEIKSQLEIKVLQISKVLLMIAITAAGVICLLSFLNGFSAEETLSITISILIATVPEGLATVLAIVLTFMSQSMAKNNALIKKVVLLETLGEVDYVCSDKTGTITENKMTVVKTLPFDINPLTEALEEAIVESDTPTTKAIYEHIMIETSSLTGKVIDSIPFNSTNKKALYLVEVENENYLVCIGGPDFLVSDIDNKIKEVEEFASNGLRTILTMYKKTELTNLDSYEITDAIDYDLITLYGIQDPPKASAIEAIKTMHNAQIQTVMITGDNIVTARAIAKQAGILQNDNELCLTGEELNKMSDEEFAKIVLNVRVYARVKPEDKYRIVSMLQKQDKIVAMTGDGTNDSIALKKANVGVAMGIQGTDIAKESADLILLDDNFATINVAIKSGRLMFDNLRKFIRQMLTSNAAHTSGILFALLFGLIFNMEIILPMTAILILWVNIISDAIPCLALGTDTAESDLMDRPPLAIDEKLLTKPMIAEILIRGFGIGFLVFVSFNFMLNQGYDEMYARTIAFVVLSFGQLIHIFDARSFNTIYTKNPFDNKLLLLAVGFSGLLNLLIIYTPLNEVFGLVAIPFNHLVIAVLFASTVTFVFSLFKLAYIKIKNK